MPGMPMTYPAGMPAARWRARSAPGTDRLVEWLLAGVMLTLGCEMLDLGSATSCDDARSAILALVACRVVWSAWSIAIATLRIAALAIGGRSRRTPLVRLGCALLGLLWWLVQIDLVAVSQADPPTGFGWSAVFAVFEAISCWRAAADACHADALRDLPFTRPRPDGVRPMPVDA